VKSTSRPAEIQGWIAELEAEGLGARSIRISHRLLSQALRQAVRWELIYRNPCEGTTLPKERKREMRSLTPVQAQRFLEAARGTRFGLFFELMLLTGLRPGEARGLRWRDLDFDAGTLTVRRAISRVKGGHEVKGPKTEASKRTIPIASLCPALRQYRISRLRHGPDDLVFSTSAGRPIGDRNLVERHFKPILEAAEIDPGVRLYDLRHTHVTLALAAEVPVRVVAERVGHSSPARTLDVYAHVLPGQQEEATRRLEALLSGAS
jgi:integrase